MPDPIRVLIVEDSPTVSRILTSFVESDPAFVVVGLATDGAEAIRLTARHRPNIITMDVNMPRMSGLEATEYIMAHYPTPILVLTAFGKQDVNLSFNMLSAGALEIIEKPEAEELKLQKKHLLERLKLLSRIKVITHVRGKQRLFKEMAPPLPAPSPMASRPPRPRFQDRLTAPLNPANIYRPVESAVSQTAANSAQTGRPDRLLAPATPVPTPELALLARHFEVMGIAASTGGPPALARLLHDLPQNLPLPVFVVQHIPAGFSPGLADWLNGETSLRVKLAEEGEQPQVGLVYLPADDRHLAFGPDGRFRLDSSPARYGLRPNADVTFESMAQVWPGKTLCIILTGMGRDGSLGMKYLHEAGGYNIAQDEASSVIFGMPKAAIELGVTDKVLPLGHIAPFLKQIFKLPAN